MAAERILLSCPRPLDPGEPITVRMAGRKRRLRVQPESCRPQTDGSYLVVARSLDKDFKVRPQPGQRNHARVPERLRAMSAELPSYRAVTVDCSEGGLLLETDGPLTVGEVLPLELSLTDLGEDMPCRVEVRWCEPHGEKGYRSGCAFVETTRAFRIELRSVLARHPEYGRRRRYRRYAVQHRIKPLPLVAPTSMTEPLESARPPVPLHTEPLPETEEQAPLDGAVVGFEARDQSVRIILELAEGERKEVELDHVVSLSDRRGRSGHQVAHLAVRTSPGKARIRFLNAWREDVLEIETRQGYPWSA